MVQEIPIRQCLVLWYNIICHKADADLAFFICAPIHTQPRVRNLHAIHPSLVRHLHGNVHT